MPTLPAAILLDLDDTILMYDHGVEAAWRAVCARYADAAGVDAETLRQAIRTQTEWFWSDPARHRRGRLDLLAARQETISAALEALGRPNPALARAMSRLREARHRESIVPFPGAVETLQALRARGVRLALVTNGAAAVQAEKIDRHGLRPFFDGIVIEGEFGLGKPEPAVFEHALRACRAAPAEAWMVGDNLALDIAGAQALGLFAVWHDVHGAGLPAHAPAVPDRIIRSLTELLA